MRFVDCCQKAQGRFARLLTSHLEVLFVQIVADGRKGVGCANVPDKRRAECREAQILPREIHPQYLEVQGARELPETQQKDWQSEARFLEVGALREGVRRDVFRRGA